jgi:hypothetical protein
MQTGGRTSSSLDEKHIDAEPGAISRPVLVLLSMSGLTQSKVEILC